MTAATAPTFTAVYTGIPCVVRAAWRCCGSWAVRLDAGDRPAFTVWARDCGWVRQ